VIDQKVYRDFLGIPHACNALAVTNTLLDLAPQILEDLGTRHTPDFPHALKFLADELAEFSMFTDVNYWIDKETDELTDNDGHGGVMDYVMYAARRVNDFTAPGGAGPKRQYEFSHPLVVVAVNTINNILNNARGHYILRDDSRIWGDAYSKIQYHAHVQSFREDDGGVELIMGPDGYRKSKTYADLGYYGRQMLLGYAGYNLEVVSVELDDERKTVLVVGREFSD
jgi:hypothetical protein